eukprot:363911-Chlamydomonas_euryale.AAC.8
MPNGVACGAVPGCATPFPVLSLLTPLLWSLACVPHGVAGGAVPGRHKRQHAPQPQPGAAAGHGLRQLLQFWRGAGKPTRVGAVARCAAFVAPPPPPPFPAPVRPFVAAMALMPALC